MLSNRYGYLTTTLKFDIIEAQQRKDVTMKTDEYPTEIEIIEMAKYYGESK